MVWDRGAPAVVAMAVRGSELAGDLHEVAAPRVAGDPRLRRRAEPLGRDSPPAAVSPRQMARTVIFLHVPRTAGTSLGIILGRQYPKGSIYRGGLLKDEDLVSFRALDEGRRANLALEAVGPTRHRGPA